MIAEFEYSVADSATAQRWQKIINARVLFYPKALLPIQRGLDLARNSQQDKQLRIEVLRGNRCIMCIYRVR